MPSAARVRWAEFRVFVVSLVALAILSTLFYLLTGGTLLQSKTTLYVYVPDATGLSKGSPVRVNGIGVGKVELVSLTGSSQPNRVVKLELTVVRAELASIPADSYAQISSDTLIGDKYIDITSGRAASSIPPGGELIYKEGMLTKTLDMQQFEQRLREVDALLTDIEQGRSRVGKLVMGEDMYEGLKNRVAQIHEDVRIATSRNTMVGQALYTEKLYRQLSDPLVDLDRRLAAIQSGQGSLGRFVRDPAQYEQVRASVQNAGRAVADLHATDFVQSDAAYTQWNKSVVSLVRTVDDFAAGQLFSAPQTYESLNGFSRELEHTLRDFRTAPQKFLRLKLF